VFIARSYFIVPIFEFTQQVW